MRAKVWAGAIVVALGVGSQPVIGNATLLPLSDPLSLTATQATFDHSFPAPAGGNFLNNPPVKTQSLPFDLFDPSLGTLISVTISLVSTFNETATLKGVFLQDTSHDCCPETFFVDGNLTMTLAGIGITPALSLSPATITAECLNIVVGTGEGTLTPCNNGNPVTQSLAPPGNFAPSSISLTTPTEIAPFIRTGAGTTFDLTASLLSALTPRIDPDNTTNPGFSDNSTFNGSFDSSWTGTVSITYDFVPSTAVPEPLTLYLLVGGLGGIALFRRRRG